MKIVNKISLVLIFTFVSFNLYADWNFECYEFGCDLSGGGSFNVNIYPYISYTILDTNGNRIWKNADNNIENGIDAGFLFSTKFDNWIFLKGLLKYEPGYPDDRPLDFESLFIDINKQFNNIKIGFVIGKIIYSYGFYGISRVHPGLSHSVYAPLNMVWLHNRVLYDNGDGYGIRLNGNFSNFNFSFEANELIHYNPKPIEEYNRGLKGSNVQRTDVKTKHLKLSWGNNELKLDRLTPTHYIEITEEFWNENFPFIPEPIRFTDDNLSQLFDLWYIGYRRFLPSIFFTFEVVRWESTGRGSINRFFDTLKINPYKGISYYHQILVNKSLDNLNFHINYGWTKGEKVHPKDNTDTGDERCFGSSYKFNMKRVYKFQYCNISDERYVPISVNDEVKRNWELVAFQFVQMF